uniref:TLC domain-containing protein n=1 Tax=Emiliania huxleyi (strain CCMP1516) TaxID=280463 RepID=A0A0D3IGG2_EMIH1
MGGTALDRLYGRSPLAERLCRLTAGYECFNLIAVVLLPEYRTAAFIGHHAVTCFLGASLSSVPLCVGELFSAAGLEALVEASKPPFVLLFLLLRTAYWPYVSAGFWQDSLWALAKPRDRAHSLVAYAALLGANVFLTGLQVFWTGQICAAVGEALGQQ